MFCKIHHRTLQVTNLKSPMKFSYWKVVQFLYIKEICVFKATEIYKGTTQINPEFMWSYFSYNNITYNLRKEPMLYLPSTHSTCYGTNSLHFGGFLIWNNLPRDIKSSKSVSELKSKLRTLEILIGDV